MQSISCFDSKLRKIQNLIQDRSRLTLLQSHRDSTQQNVFHQRSLRKESEIEVKQRLTSSTHPQLTT